MQLAVTFISPQKVIFKGEAKSIILPGEQGVLEILPYHKRLLSRLVSGIIFIDEQSFGIIRGLVKVDQNKVVIIAEGVV